MRNSAIIRLIVLFVFVSCTAASIINVVSSSAQPPCDWIEYSNNPLFGQWLGNPNRAYYPKVIYDANQFSSGNGTSAYYKMWFNTYNGVYSIRYAYSDNGTSWTEATPVNGLASSSGHPLVKYDPSGFGNSGYFYKIWYWDNGANGYTINALRYAESIDGVNWTHDQVFSQDDILKLVTGIDGDWDKGSNGPCDLIYNPGGSNYLDDSSLWNNKYVLYYMGNNGNNEFIGLAYSDNATHWKRYDNNGNNPVLSPCSLTDNVSAGWDYRSVGYCSVINLSGSWQMWYGGGPGTNYGIGYATSTDGINWTKHPDNPIFHRDDGELWRNDRTYTPWVVYDAANFSGHGSVCTSYKMWFTGVWFNGDDNQPQYKYSIGFAYIKPPAADAGPDQTIISGGSAVIGGSPTASGGIPPYNYSWTPTTGLNDSTLANPTASPTSTTTYTVTVTDNKSCTGSDSMTVSVQLPPPPPPPPPSPLIGGGGGSGMTAALVACPLALAADIEGNITIASMSSQGVLCETCIAKDASGKYVLELDKDTKIALASNAVPRLLRFSESSAPPAAPENTAIISSVYEISAYPTSYATIPSPVTISPAAMLTLTYDPKKLPTNATEVFIADYDAAKGWLALAPVPGVVAELGKAQGLASHFSPVAILARLAEPTPAKFEVSNLTINPSQTQPNQKVTISINVTNTGGESGDYNLDLKVDGTVKSSKQVIVAAGTSQTVNFTTTGNAAGKHQVEVAGLSGEFEILKVSQPANTNWWFIGGVTAIILLILALLIALRR
jgi:hypothetical protein